MIDLGGITLIVTGFPRSGTSMMMRMLGLGGVELLYDKKLQDGPYVNQFDPYGVMELERPMDVFKGHPTDFTANMAVKLTTPMIRCLPIDRPLKAIFMLRDQTEIISSMLAKRDLWQPEIAESIAFARYYLDYNKVPTLYLHYKDVINYPKSFCTRIENFLEVELDIPEMVTGADGKVRERYKDDPKVTVFEPDEKKLILFERPAPDKIEIQRVLEPDEDPDVVKAEREFLFDSNINKIVAQYVGEVPEGQEYVSGSSSSSRQHVPEKTS